MRHSGWGMICPGWGQGRSPSAGGWDGDAHLSLSLKPPCPSLMSPRSPTPPMSCSKPGTSSSSAPGRPRFGSVCAGGKRPAGVPEPGDGDSCSVSPKTVPFARRRCSAWLLPSPAGLTWATPSSWHADTPTLLPPAPLPTPTPSAKVSSVGALGTGQRCWGHPSLTGGSLPKLARLMGHPQIARQGDRARGEGKGG